MERLQELHNKLCGVLGTSNVYFNPPETTKLKYPCIIYHREDGDSKYADDKLYRYYKSYQITVIDRNPTSDLSDKIHYNFDLCQFERWYIADGLNHWILRLYY